MKTLAARYIPAGSTKIVDKQSDAVAYLYTSTKTGLPNAIIFYGKQTKPVAHFRFQNLEKREKCVRQYFESRRAYVDRKAAEKAKRVAFVNPYKVGDVFKSTWGYDQTNVDYFECVEVSGSMLTVRQIGCESVDRGNMTGRSAPSPGKFIGPELRRRATETGFKVDYCSYASRMTPTIIAGVPVYAASEWTAYA